MTKMLFDTSACKIDVLQDELFNTKKIDLAVLRLDKLHAIVSGNKLFKLHYFLQDALASPNKSIVTFGGAYSNHLVATAYASAQLHIKCIGIIRGEKPPQLSATLQQCLEYGMELQFISRDHYAVKDAAEFIDAINEKYNSPVLIPEGGFSVKGAQGAALIMEQIDHSFTHIATAIGTATTLAGLLNGAVNNQRIIGVPILKGMTDITDRINAVSSEASSAALEIIDGYHFGGYAKHNHVLINFMNECWVKYHLPLDFVYTAKMMFAIIDKIKNDHFAEGSKILCLHTGGLQGNRSLTAGTLMY